ncbi:NifU family protein [Luteolibacter flavescens]|nr:NifU family protein [Luteolibacter flavescens]
MRADLLERAREAAGADGRTLSNWIEQLLKEKFPDVEDSEGKGK